MSQVNPAFVFVHGAWHDAATWRLVTPLLEARGYVARALDLPGAGRNAKAPRSYGRRPLDPAAFAIERSPNAEVSQQDRTREVSPETGKRNPCGRHLLQRNAGRKLGMQKMFCGKKDCRHCNDDAAK